LELMRAEEGIGLAAPQVGVNLRLFVSNISGDPKDDLVFVNPQLTELGEPGDSEEGCLSIPDVRGVVRRYMKCRITAQDLAGRPVDFRAEMLAARCYQHECDHLDGTLIIDRMGEADKIANRKKLKQLETDASTVRRARAR
jgi:peptide deformylase